MTGKHRVGSVSEKLESIVPGVRSPEWLRVKGTKESVVTNHNRQSEIFMRLRYDCNMEVARVGCSGDMPEEGMERR